MVFYELPAKEFPLQMDYFYLANGWCSGRGRYSHSVKLINPDGSTMCNTGEQMIELTDPTVPFMVVNKFESMEFNTPGIYKIQVFLDGELRLEYPLTIRQLA